jgi:uncharacterized protein (TIGR03435 family)
MYRLCLTLGILITGVSHAQSFDAASLKPSGDKSVRGSDGGPGSRDPGRYTFGQATALDLIMVAWQVDPFQVSSKSALDGQRFDLNVTVPPGVTKEDFRAMMRNLLAERFHLKMHMETREFPAYELVVAKSGLKMKESPDKPDARPKLRSTMSNGGDGVLIRLTVEQATMADLVRHIPLPERTRVFDKTGLTGKYDFAIEYTYDMPGASSANAQPSGVPNVFRAFEQELGLRLVTKRLPFDVVVVDSIDKVPTEN